MRKFPLAAAALVALAGPAVAADSNPADTAPSAVVGAWNWTGCFAGGHTGGLRARSSDWIVRTPGGAHFGESLGSHGLNSWIGGVRAGCDYQFAGSALIGLQGDYDWANASGNHDSAREFGVSYHSKLGSVATLAARVGYTRDRFLGYLRGGAAWEGADYSAISTMLGTAYTATTTRLGWAAGFGGEYAVTDCLSGFIEYNHYDFGLSQIAFTPQVAGLLPAFLAIKDTTNLVRVGINLRW